MDGLISGLNQISPFLSTIIDLAYQTGLLLLAFWLGKLALKGYRKKINGFLKIIASLGIGFLIYLTSKPVSRFIPINLPFLTDFVALFFPVLIFFLIFLLIFEGKKLEYVTTPALERVERLANELAKKLENIEKGKSSTELGFNFFKQQVKSKLEELGAADYEITERRRKDHFYLIRVLDHRAKYNFKFNVISGRLEQLKINKYSIKKRLKEAPYYFWDNKKKLVGLLILISFLTFSAIYYPVSTTRKTGNLNLSDFSDQNNKEACLGPLKLFKKLKTLEKSDYNTTKQELVSWFNETGVRIQTMPNQSVVYNQERYLMVQVQKETVKFCSINLEKKEACGCINKSQVVK